VRAAILAQEASPRLMDVLPPLSRQIATRWDRMYDLGGVPDYEPPPEKSIAALAAKTNQSPQEYCYDFLTGGDGSRMLYFPVTNYVHGDLEVVREMITDPHTVLGLSDYQLLQIDAPAVPADEMKAAARWQIKDKVDIPVEELTLDVLAVGDQRAPFGHGRLRAQTQKAQSRCVQNCGRQTKRCLHNQRRCAIGQYFYEHQWAGGSNIFGVFFQQLEWSDPVTNRTAHQSSDTKLVWHQFGGYFAC
jgi:hypothetical protein